MHLNIKHHETHKLAAELAKLRGTSISQAVTDAIREKLEEEKRRSNREALAKELLEIGRRCAAHARRDRRSHGDFLYDERGLPKK